MVFINYIEKHLLLVEIMDDYFTKILHLDKINENSNKIEELREIIEVSNMKLNELKLIVREQEHLIRRIINKPAYIHNERYLNYYGSYALNAIYMCLFIYLLNKL